MNSKELANLNRLRNVSRNVDVSGKADISYVDDRDEATLSEAKFYTDEAEKNATGSGDVASHMNDTTIHITANERSAWNNKSDSGHNHDEKYAPKVHEHDQYITEHQDISGKANVADLNSHTGNKSNPHGVTKTQIGLGNVENKSSETIRSEITSANVTNALGFIPASADGGGASINSTHITLTTSGWTVSGDTYSQTVNVSGMTATSIVLVTPDMSTGDSYSEFGVIAVGQGSGTLTFKAYILPDVNLTVGVVNLGEES